MRDNRDRHSEHLQREGVDVLAEERTSQLRVGWEDPYLKDGYIDQDRQIHLLGSLIIAGLPQENSLRVPLDDFSRRAGP